MPTDTDLTSILHRIREVAATAQRSGSPDAMRQALADIAELASRHFGDTPGESDLPRTENQSL